MQLNNILDRTATTRTPVLVWGPPGVGKSAAIQQWASSRGLRCWTVIASLREPSDFGGLPVLAPRGTDAGLATVDFVPPRFAVEAAEHGGVIFLDELTTAPPAVQAALLRAVLDRAFGDLQLDPAKVALVAAANPPDVAAGGWDLAAPLANRFVHVQYELSATHWVEDFPHYWGQAPTLTFGSRTLPEKDWAHARSLVAAFVRARPALLLQLPGAESGRGQAWPSPRSWDFASRLITGTGAAAVGEGSEDLLAGCVGEGPALEFLAWLRELDLPDPEVLLTEPDGYKHPRRGDQAYAILTAVTLAALADLTPERWLAAWRVLSLAAASGGADVAAAAARQLAQHNSPGLPLPVEQLTAFLPVLQASGLLKVG